MRIITRIFGRRLHRIENPWAGAPAWAIEIGLIGLRILELLERLIATQEKDDMATAKTMEQLLRTTAANTNATQAAKDTLDHFVQSQADLVNRLKAAIADSEGADDADVNAAIQAIDANTAQLQSSTSAAATAITANTPAAGGPAPGAAGGAPQPQSGV